MIHTSAPGKLFLLGEYAVLEGAPALLTAVDRRVSVTITESTADRWSLRTPGTGLDALTLEAHGLLPDQLDARIRRGLRLFDSVRAIVAAQAVPGRSRELLHGLAITIDSTAFHRDGHKLGLGSSAAVAAALVAALSSASGLALSADDLFRLAHSAHRLAQGGTGSGGDIAASVYGGLIGYSCNRPPTTLTWPAGLVLTVVATGTGSSTRELVGKVMDYAVGDASGYHADLGRLTALAEQAEHALHSASGFLDLAADYFDALAILDEHAGAGIITDRHRELHKLAAGLGAVFKTSGAGGGDVGLAFSRSGSATDELLAALNAAGARVIPLSFGAAGLEDGS